MKKLTDQKIYTLCALLAPSLYLLMYTPIWNGKEFVLYNTFTIILFIFQCVCLVMAILHLLLVKLRKNDSCLLVSVFGFFTVSSIVITCFVGLIFVLELFNIQWFPAQN